MKPLIFTLLSIFLLQCSPRPTETVRRDPVALPKEPEEVMAVDSLKVLEDIFRQEEMESEPETGETVLRYKSFTLIIHDFMGYEILNGEGGDYLPDSSQAKLRWMREGSEGDKGPYLRVLVDTLLLYEMAGTSYLLHNRMEIKADPADRFEMSYAYEWSLSELFEDSSLTWQQKEELYKNAFSVNGVTEFYPLKDSLKRFFLTPAMPSYDKWKTTVDGMMTLEQYERVAADLRARYALTDTEIMFSGEAGATYALFRQGHRLFNFSNNNYLFRVQRFRGNRLMETKFLRIEMSKGC